MLVRLLNQNALTLCKLKYTTDHWGERPLINYRIYLLYKLFVVFVYYLCKEQNENIWRWFKLGLQFTSGTFIYCDKLQHYPKSYS